MIIAGVDEAGRGALAGPVYAAAVILDPMKPIKGLADSKLLTAKRRAVLAHEIQQNALAWSVASASAEEIDAINILQASLLAMKRAVETLTVSPQRVLVDGRESPNLNCEVHTLIKGDQLEPAISAASILAKVARDILLCEYEEIYPGYDFAVHKGYGTQRHMQRLLEKGPCPEHRRTFAPVRELL